MEQLCGPGQRCLFLSAAPLRGCCRIKWDVVGVKWLGALWKSRILSQGPQLFCRGLSSATWYSSTSSKRATFTETRNMRKRGQLCFLPAALGEPTRSAFPPPGLRTLTLVLCRRLAGRGRAEYGELPWKGWVRRNVLSTRSTKLDSTSEQLAEDKTTQAMGRRPRFQAWPCHCLPR